jgi:hypothetical protein
LTQFILMFSQLFAKFAKLIALTSISIGNKKGPTKCTPYKPDPTHNSWTRIKVFTGKNQTLWCKKFYNIG